MSQNFASSHNSYLINLKYVTYFDKHSLKVRLRDSKTDSLPMSQRKYVSFKKSFLEYMENTI